MPEPAPSQLTAELRALLGDEADRLGLVIVDHGSRRAESNELLLEVAAMFRRATGLQNIEPAHMELAPPSIADAFDALVERGVRLVVVVPYFLAPGRHWREDIPRLAAEAAARRPGVRHMVTAPLGLHEALAAVMTQRISDCMRVVAGEAEACDACRGGEPCRLDVER